MKNCLERHLRRFLILVPLLAGLALGHQEQASVVAQAATDWRFGVIESYEDPVAAGQLGAAWSRILFHWAEVQQGGAGTWTPKISEAQINNEISAGRQLVGLLIGIPGWAIDGNGLPRGLWSPHTDPANAWATFVREAVSRYQGRISHWIIWNEPDIRHGAIAHTWNGSVNDFFQLQRVAYLVAKEVNPASVIHLSAFTYWADANAGTEQYMARLLDQIMTDPAAPEHNYYFDVATAHLYFQPAQVFDLIQFFIGLMRQRGMAQPIWLLETNVPPFDDPVWPVANPFLKATLAEQAAFMPQVIASALAAGAQRIAIYKLKDNETDRAANPEPFGLIRVDGSRRPAFETYRLAMRTLRGMTGVRRERWDGVGQIRVAQGEGSTTVLFSRLPAPQTAQVSADGSAALLIDMWGTQQVVTAVDGTYVITLPGAACTQAVGEYCMVGGTTYYLVQSKQIEESLADPTPTPTQTSTETATVIPTTVPSQTSTPSPTVFPSATNTALPTTTPTIGNSPTSRPTSTPSRVSAPEPSGTARPAEQVAAESSGQTARPEETGLASSLAESTRTNEPALRLSGESLSYWFIGAGLIIALALVFFTYLTRVRG
jgi:hypothetical protein